jgi:hypothetical protein
MSTDTVETYRSREVVGDDELQTLLNSLKLDQIRTAVLDLAPEKMIKVKTHKEAMDALERTRRDTQTIRQALLSVEASAPFRHCVFSRVIGENINEKVPTSTFVGDAKSKGFGLTVAYVEVFNSCTSITLEHKVKVLDWVQTGPKSKAVRENEVRHPIVLRLYSKQGIAAFFYPGFDQGSATPRDDRIEYSNLIADAMSFVSDKLGVSFTALPVKDCIKVFLEGANNRVRVIQSDVDSASGKLSFSSAFQEKAVEDVLVEYFEDVLPPDTLAIIRDACRKALALAFANSVVLFWFEEKIVTRLRFWDIGTDMLFVWHGVPKSFRIVEEIVGLFQATYKMLPMKDNKENPLEWLSKTKSGEVIRPADFAARFSLSREQSRSNLLSAMHIGLVQPIYRLKTAQFLLDRTNHWTKDPNELNRIFDTDEGKIDGTDPSQIEVAFLRVDAGGNV